MYSIFDRFHRNDHSGMAPVAGPQSTEQIRPKRPTPITAYTIMCWIGICTSLIGCGSSPNPDRPDVDVAEARRVFEADAITDEELAALEDEPLPIKPHGSGTGGYTILLTGVPETMRRRPDVALERVATAVDMPGIRLMEQSAGRPPLIVLGRYTDPDGPEAQRDLRKVRALSVDGRKPFTGAVLVADVEAVPADTRLARHDLRQAKKLDDDAVYTLQIGVYAREDNTRPSAADLASFREAAEDAVTRLRREGEEAFFYHGPNGSMVTVGLFNDDDMDTSIVPPIESQRLEDARRRHPNNLLNGRGVRETIRGDTGRAEPRLQPSRLVLIPD